MVADGRVAQNLVLGSSASLRLKPVHSLDLRVSDGYGNTHELTFDEAVALRNVLNVALEDYARLGAVENQ